MFYNLFNQQYSDPASRFLTIQDLIPRDGRTFSVKATYPILDNGTRIALRPLPLGPENMKSV